MDEGPAFALLLSTHDAVSWRSFCFIVDREIPFATCLLLIVGAGASGRSGSYSVGAHVVNE